MMRRCRAVLLFVLLGALAGRAARAQGTNPLRKVELVRLLATGVLSKPEIAALVRRNCVTFRPTERDRADLRAAGAGVAVLAAVDECVRGRPIGEPAAPPSTTAALQVLTSAKVSAEAGTDVEVLVQVLRSRAPQRGVQLLLRGAGAIPGGLGQDAVAVTNQRGFASFRVPAGTAAATYRLSVALPSGPPIGGAGQIDFVTRPARPARGVATPAELALREGAPGGGAVTVTVTDRYGNRVSGVPVELRPGTAALAAGVRERITDDHGEATFVLAPGSVRQGGELAVLARGVRIGSLTVRSESVVLSRERTQFTRGAELHGIVGAPLAQLLVFEVRDTSDAPAVGQLVTSSATGAAVEPAAAQTDSSGAVRVRVTLGERAGAVVVLAKVGTILRTATVYADPGPTRELAVERDGAPVAGAVAVRSRDPVVLRVVARDAHGNETPLTEFTATASGQAVRVKSAAATGSQAVVTLEPRRSGSGELEIYGSGLEARVPVQVAFPVGRRAWALGVRSTWVGFDYAWQGFPAAKGRSGAAVTVFGRRVLSGGLSVALGADFGVVSADTVKGTVSPSVLEGYGRAEFAPISRGAVTPVVSFGAGGYRLKGGDNGRQIYHTNTFWSAGFGLDFVMSPKLTAELRVERQWMTDANQGHVATLWPVGAGVRIAL